MRPISHQERLKQQRSQQRRVAAVISFGCLSILVHAFLISVGIPLWPWLMGSMEIPDGGPISLVLLDPDEPDKPEDVLPDFHGQIVDLPPPEEEKTPLDADYLAEHERVVENETRSERYKINPEVLAPSTARRPSSSSKICWTSAPPSLPPAPGWATTASTPTATAGSRP